MATDLPVGAITAAREAAADGVADLVRDLASCETAELDHLVREALRLAADAALEAAAGAIRKAERARIIALADAYRCPCGEDDCGASEAVGAFADTLTGGE